MKKIPKKLKKFWEKQLDIPIIKSWRGFGPKAFDCNKAKKDFKFNYEIV